jgi:hypothetical protein
MEHTYEIHDQDSNLDGQLLDDDERTTLLFTSDLSQIHRNLTARNANSGTLTWSTATLSKHNNKHISDKPIHTIKYSTSNKHTKPISSSLKHRTGNSEKARVEDRITTTNPVRKRSSDR